MNLKDKFSTAAALSNFESQGFASSKGVGLANQKMFDAAMSINLPSNVESRLVTEPVGKIWSDSGSALNFETKPIRLCAIQQDPVKVLQAMIDQGAKANAKYIFVVHWLLFSGADGWYTRSAWLKMLRRAHFPLVNSTSHFQSTKIGQNARTGTG